MSRVTTLCTAASTPAGVGAAGRRRLQTPGGLAHRIRRPAAHRQSARACGWRRSAPAGAPALLRPGRRCGGCCRVRAPPRRRFRGSPRARAAVRPRCAAVWRCVPRGQCGGQDILRRGAFAKVMRQAGKAHHQWRVQPGGHVQHHHQVHAGVHLGGGAGAAGARPQARHFGQQHLQRPASRAAPRTCARALLPSGRAPVPATRAPGTRWSTSPCSTISRISCMVSGATVKSVNAPRSGPRAGCAPGLRGTSRSHAAAAGPAGLVTPWYGSNSTVAPVESALLAMELMVRSRRERSSSSVTLGELSTTKPGSPARSCARCGPARIPRAFQGAKHRKSRPTGK